MRVSRRVTFIGVSATSPGSANPQPTVIPPTTIGHVDNSRTWKVHTIQIVATILYLNSVNTNIVAAVTVDVFASGRPLLTTPLTRVTQFFLAGFGSSYSQWNATVALNAPEEIYMGDQIAMSAQVTPADQTAADTSNAQLIGAYPFGLSYTPFPGLNPTYLNLTGDEIPAGRTVNVLG